MLYIHRFNSYFHVHQGFSPIVMANQEVNQEGISGWIGETLDQRYPKITDPLVSLDQDECQSGSC